MLKFNFISDVNSTENINAVFTCVNYEKNLMYIHLNNDSIARCDDIIANKSGIRTEEEIKVAESIAIQ